MEHRTVNSKPGRRKAIPRRVGAQQEGSGAAEKEKRLPQRSTASGAAGISQSRQALSQKYARQYRESTEAVRTPCKTDKIKEADIIDASTEVAVNDTTTREDKLIHGLSVRALSLLIGKSYKTIRSWTTNGVLPEPIYVGIEYTDSRYYSVKEVSAIISCLKDAEVRYLKPDTPDAQRIHNAVNNVRRG